MLDVAGAAPVLRDAHAVDNDRALGLHVDARGVFYVLAGKSGLAFDVGPLGRPQIVGQALQKISEDPAISQALFKVLETQNIIEGQAAITLVPPNSGFLGNMVAATQAPKAAIAK